jgi:hypothetical protein
MTHGNRQQAIEREQREKEYIRENSPIESVQSCFDNWPDFAVVELRGRIRRDV